MGTKTGIEWTDTTWNPVAGCHKLSPGCDNCYAESIAHRFAGTKAYPNGFDVTLHPERLGQPLRWRKPRRVFVNSMSDLFHKDVPDDYIAQVFSVMALTPRHTFQVLTKRPGRMRSLLSRPDFRELMADNMQPTEPDPDQANDWLRFHAPAALPNVWLGVSAESQTWANVRIPVLLETPAAVRFVSAEPLLEPLDLTEWLHDSICLIRTGEDEICTCYEPYETRLDWVIVGGESGHRARPMELHWVRELRDQCNGSDTPFLFKQWGEWAPNYAIDDVILIHPMHRVGKKAAGRELDGRTWDEYPGGVS